MVTTITVSDETLERFKSLKSETGDGEAIAELSSDQFLNSLLDAWEENDKSIYGTPTVEVPQDMRKQLDRIEAAAKEATQTAQDTQHTLEGL